MHFTADHQAFREAARGVLEREVVPHAQEWEEAGTFPAHELFPALGAAGLLGLEYDPAYGGQGADHSYTVILGEELGRIGCAGVADGHRACRPTWPPRRCTASAPTS